MNDPDDDELRTWLRALGRAGERRAPTFQRTWRAASEARRVAAPPWRMAWVVTAAAAIALCAVALVPRQAAPVVVGPVVAAPVPLDDPLPTDFLLTINHDSPVDRVAGEIDTLLRP
jgi:hypothetical protein